MCNDFSFPIFQKLLFVLNVVTEHSFFFFPSPNWNLVSLWRCHFIYSSFAHPVCTSGWRGNNSIFLVCHCYFQTAAFPHHVKYPPLKLTLQWWILLSVLLHHRPGVSPSFIGTKLSVTCLLATFPIHSKLLQGLCEWGSLFQNYHPPRFLHGLQLISIFSVRLPLTFIFKLEASQFNILSPLSFVFFKALLPSDIINLLSYLFAYCLWEHRLHRASNFVCILSLTQSYFMVSPTMFVWHISKWANDWILLGEFNIHLTGPFLALPGSLHLHGHHLTQLQSPLANLLHLRVHHLIFSQFSLSLNLHLLPGA